MTPMDELTGDYRSMTWVTASPGQFEDLSDEEKWSTTYRGRNMLMGLTGCVLNVLTLIAVIRHKDLSGFLRCALVSLVSTDLGLPVVVFVASGISNTPDCVTLVIVHLVYVFIDCTALNLLVIALDRACAVYYPAWYKSSSEKFVKILLLVPSPWGLAVCFSAATFRRDTQGLPRYPLAQMKESGLLLQGILLLVCGVGVLVSYLAIGFRLRLRVRRFVVHPSFVTTAATGHMTPAEGQRNRRITVHTAFLAAWFCLIYMAFSFYLLVVYLTQMNVLNEFNSSRNIIMSSFILINSIVNPFLFFWRLVTFRSAFNFIRRIWRRKDRTSPQQDQNTVEMEMAPARSMVVEANLSMCHVTSPVPLRPNTRVNEGKHSVPKERQSENSTIATISC